MTCESPPSLRPFPGSSAVRPRSGFTLIELLVVMAIIALLSGFVIAALGGDDGTRSLNAAISRMDSTFSLARSAAISRKTPTRVLVSFDPSHPNYLRHVQVFYFNPTPPSPATPRWEPFAEPELLPRNIHFNVPLSRGTIGLPQGWSTGMDTQTFALINPAANLTPNPSPSAGNWLVYEFNSNGTVSTESRKRFILSRGINPTNLDDNLSAGFVLFRSGKTVFFKDRDHMGN